MSARDEYEKKRDTMDEKARSRKEKELTDLYTEVQKLSAEAQSKFNDEKNAGMAPIVKKVQEIAARIGRDEKYDFILEKGAVHYLGNDKEDLTKRISAELDKSK
jgi:Skp family chaperone for outer membrane proteins